MARNGVCMKLGVELWGLKKRHFSFRMPVKIFSSLICLESVKASCDNGEETNACVQFFIRGDLVRSGKKSSSRRTGRDCDAC